MRRRGESIEETLDVGFRSTGDDNLEPSRTCGSVGQTLQNSWTTPIVATFVKGVDDKDKVTFWGTRKFADEVMEKRVLHRVWCYVWVVTKTFCHNASKRGKNYGKFVDECWKDISGFA